MILLAPWYHWHKYTNQKSHKVIVESGKKKSSTTKVHSPKSGIAKIQKLKGAPNSSGEWRKTQVAETLGIENGTPF